MKFLERQFTLFTLSRWMCFTLLGVLLTQSCVVPRKYPVNKPFVYKTKIDIIGNIPFSEKQQMEERLQNQLDDSLKVRVISYAGIRKEIIRPPAFDSLNVGRSVIFMRSLLNSQGYFNPEINWTADTNNYNSARRKTLEEKGQYRVSINFRVIPGKLTRLDSIGYDLSSPELQRLVMAHRHESLVKKNDPFSLQVISNELDRMLNLFRNNGYFKLTREYLFAERDTVVAALIDPTLDPFEQLRLLDSLQRKRVNPTINVVFKQRAVRDTTHLQKFYIGNITVHPDVSILEDGTEKKDTTVIGRFTFLTNTDRFKLNFITRKIRLRPDSLYRQDAYYRTINNFNQLGAWSSVDLSMEERYDSLPRVDATLRLYPEKRQSLTVDYEVSRNVSEFITAGQLFGLGINVRLLNRNAYREAIQTSTNARFGIELGPNFIQTLQANLSHTINISRFLARLGPVPANTIGQRTVMNLNAAYTDRRDFFQVRSFNASWAYEWSLRRSRAVQPEVGRAWTKTFQSVPINLEYAIVNKTDSLIKLMDLIPSYQFAFNDGLIISRIFSFSAGREVGNKFTLWRIRGEQSGALTGLIKKLDEGDLRRFIKLDGEFKHYINFKKSALAFRAFAGYGYVYGKTDTLGNGDPKDIVNENNLPFFKAFFGGGPYSMRAWPIRRIGPGSSILYDTAKRERFGNIQLELNAEYRFNITTIAGIKVGSALFVDMGNIWSNEFTEDNKKIDEASFKLSRLYKDIAIGAGTSLRFDFDFFLIRLDWAYRLKDPAWSNENDGWFHDLKLVNGQFQLGIGYPF
jgi:outer membrane protein insertion porin family